MVLLGKLLTYSLIAAFTAAGSQCATTKPTKTKHTVTHHSTRKHSKKTYKPDPTAAYPPLEIHLEPFEISKYQITSPVPDAPRPDTQPSPPAPTPVPKKQVF